MLLLGHSRTCIGIEEHAQGDFKKHLLLFDPSYKPKTMAALKNLKLPNNKTQTRELRKSLYQMKQQQFQVVFVDGLYDNENEKEVTFLQIILFNFYSFFSSSFYQLFIAVKFAFITLLSRFRSYLTEL